LNRGGGGYGRNPPPEISPVKHDYYHQPPHPSQRTNTSTTQSNKVGTGLPIGRSELDEKALKKQRQAEYKNQLDAQSQLRQNEAPTRSNNPQDRGGQRQGGQQSYQEVDQYSLPKYQQSYPPRQGPPPRENDMGMPIRQQPRQAPPSLNGPLRDDYDHPHHPSEPWESDRRSNPSTRPMREESETNNIHRSHLKGVVGKVNQESQDPDKNQKRRQQEEYRRQLEIQARADQSRKDQEKKIWKGDGVVATDQGETEVVRGGPRQAQGQDQGRNHRSSSQREDSYDEPDEYYDRKPNHQRQEEQGHYPGGGIGKESGVGRGNNPVNIPVASPTKARNRMIADVYGGFALGNVGEDPIGKISMRGQDPNDARKKAAMREQQLALEQQIEEKKRLKELEAEKLRLEEEKYLAEASKPLVEKEKPPVAIPSSETKPKDQKDQQQGEGTTSRANLLEKAAQQVAREKLRLHKARQEEQEAAYEEESPPRKQRNAQIPTSPGTPPPKKIPRPPLPSNPFLEDLGLPSGYGSDDDEHEHRRFKPPSSKFDEASRRMATPGGSLEQESHIVPILGSENQRESFRDEKYHRYRQHIDEEDRVVVDWQHHRGYSTRRGTTPGVVGGGQPQQPLVKAHADPWGPDGLLTLLSKKPPSENRREDSSIIEQSLVSESLLMFLDPPPSRSGTGKKKVQSLITAPSPNLFLIEINPNLS
jgi:hypothetical protein